MSGHIASSFAGAAVHGAVAFRDQVVQHDFTVGGGQHAPGFRELLALARELHLPAVLRW
jgi:hypothetical protein